jgi:hypothetical protein
MDPQGSLPCSQNVDPFSTMSRINPVHILAPCLINNHFNLILPNLRISRNWSLPFTNFEFNVVWISHLPHAYCMPRPAHPSSFVHLHNFTDEYKSWSSSLCICLRHFVMCSPLDRIRILRLLLFYKEHLNTWNNAFAMKGKRPPKEPTLNLFQNRHSAQDVTILFTPFKMSAFIMRVPSKSIKRSRAFLCHVFSLATA